MDANIQPKKIVNQMLGRDGVLYFEVVWKNNWIPLQQALTVCGSTMINEFHQEHGLGPAHEKTVSINSKPSAINQNTGSKLSSRIIKNPAHFLNSPDKNNINTVTSKSMKLNVPLSSATSNVLSSTERISSVSHIPIKKFYQTDTPICTTVTHCSSRELNKHLEEIVTHSHTVTSCKNNASQHKESSTYTSHDNHSHTVTSCKNNASQHKESSTNTSHDIHSHTVTSCKNNASHHKVSSTNSSRDTIISVPKTLLNDISRSSSLTNKKSSATINAYSNIKEAISSSALVSGCNTRQLNVQLGNASEASSAAPCKTSKTTQSSSTTTIKSKTKHNASKEPFHNVSDSSGQQNFQQHYHQQLTGNTSCHIHVSSTHTQHLFQNAVVISSSQNIQTNTHQSNQSVLRSLPVGYSNIHHSMRPIITDSLQWRTSITENTQGVRQHIFESAPRQPRGPQEVGWPRQFPQGAKQGQLLNIVEWQRLPDMVKYQHIQHMRHVRQPEHLPQLQAVSQSQQQILRPFSEPNNFNKLSAPIPNYPRICSVSSVQPSLNQINTIHSSLNNSISTVVPSMNNLPSSNVKISISNSQPELTTSLVYNDLYHQPHTSSSTTLNNKKSVITTSLATPSKEQLHINTSFQIPPNTASAGSSVSTSLGIMSNSCLPVLTSSHPQMVITKTNTYPQNIEINMSTLRPVVSAIRPTSEVQKFTIPPLIPVPPALNPTTSATVSTSLSQPFLSTVIISPTKLNQSEATISNQLQNQHLVLSPTKQSPVKFTWNSLSSGIQKAMIEKIKSPPATTQTDPVLLKDVYKTQQPNLTFTFASGIVKRKNPTITAETVAKTSSVKAIVPSCTVTSAVDKNKLISSTLPKATVIKPQSSVASPLVITAATTYTASTTSSSTTTRTGSTTTTTTSVIRTNTSPVTTETITPNYGPTDSASNPKIIATNSIPIGNDLYCIYCDRNFMHRRQFRFHLQTYCKRNSSSEIPTNQMYPSNEDLDNLPHGLPSNKQVRKPSKSDLTKQETSDNIAQPANVTNVSDTKGVVTEKLQKKKRNKKDAIKRISNNTPKLDASNRKSLKHDMKNSEIWKADKVSNKSDFLKPSPKSKAIIPAQSIDGKEIIPSLKLVTPETSRIDFSVTSPLDNQPILPITGFDELLNNDNVFDVPFKDLVSSPIPSKERTEEDFPKSKTNRSIFANKHISVNDNDVKNNKVENCDSGTREQNFLNNEQSIGKQSNQCLDINTGNVIPLVNQANELPPAYMRRKTPLLASKLLDDFDSPVSSIAYDLPEGTDSVNHDENVFKDNSDAMRLDVQSFSPPLTTIHHNDSGSPASSIAYDLPEDTPYCVDGYFGESSSYFVENKVDNDGTECCFDAASKKTKHKNSSKKQKNKQGERKKLKSRRGKHQKNTQLSKSIGGKEDLDNNLKVENKINDKITKNSKVNAKFYKKTNKSTSKTSLKKKKKLQRLEMEDKVFDAEIHFDEVQPDLILGKRKREKSALYCKDEYNLTEGSRQLKHESQTESQTEMHMEAKDGKVNNSIMKLSNIEDNNKGQKLTVNVAANKKNDDFPSDKSETIKMKKQKKKGRKNAKIDEIFSKRNQLIPTGTHVEAILFHDQPTTGANQNEFESHATLDEPVIKRRKRNVSKKVKLKSDKHECDNLFDIQAQQHVEELNAHLSQTLNDSEGSLNLSLADIEETYADDNSIVDKLDFVKPPNKTVKTKKLKRTQDDVSFSTSKQKQDNLSSISNSKDNVSSARKSKQDDLFHIGKIEKNQKTDDIFPGIEWDHKFHTSKAKQLNNTLDTKQSNRQTYEKNDIMPSYPTVKNLSINKKDSVDLKSPPVAIHGSKEAEICFTELVTKLNNIQSKSSSSANDMSSADIKNKRVKSVKHKRKKKLNRDVLDTIPSSPEDNTNSKQTKTDVTKCKLSTDSTTAFKNTIPATVMNLTESVRPRKSSSRVRSFSEHDKNQTDLDDLPPKPKYAWLFDDNFTMLSSTRKGREFKSFSVDELAVKYEFVKPDKSSDETFRSVNVIEKENYENDKNKKMKKRGSYIKELNELAPILASLTANSNDASLTPNTNNINQVTATTTASDQSNFQNVVSTTIIASVMPAEAPLLTVQSEIHSIPTDFAMDTEITAASDLIKTSTCKDASHVDFRVSCTADASTLTVPSSYAPVDYTSTHMHKLMHLESLTTLHNETIVTTSTSYTAGGNKFIMKDLTEHSEKQGETINLREDAANTLNTCSKQNNITEHGNQITQIDVQNIPSIYEMSEQTSNESQVLIQDTTTLSNLNCVGENQVVVQASQIQDDMGQMGYSECLLSSDDENKVELLRISEDFVESNQSEDDIPVLSSRVRKRKTIVYYENSINHPNFYGVPRTRQNFNENTCSAATRSFFLSAYHTKCFKVKVLKSMEELQVILQERGLNLCC